MKKKAQIALLVLVVLIGMVALFTSTGRAHARNTLAAYKAKLRAQGEKLTFVEAGYPFPLETNANLESFTVLVERLRTMSDTPGSMETMHYEAPGRVLVSWVANGPVVAAAVRKGSAPPTWADLAADFEPAADLFAEIRAELAHPPRYFGGEYTNLLSSFPKNPFVQKRTAAQFLTADALLALHERKLPRAQTNLHALTQLAQVHRDDPMLISAMIRVAIARLGLSATWEALEAEGWNDAGLLSLQRDWESIDLVRTIETAFEGERLHAGEVCTMVRLGNINAQQVPSSRGMPGISGGYFRASLDDEEVFILQQCQARLEAVRRLRTNASGALVQAELTTQQAMMEAAFKPPIGQFRHWLSSIALPNYGKASEAALRGETQRRMTITAIALKRYHLRNGHYPAVLANLAPQWLATELLDPWSGKPFHYRLNADGTFTLYSVGEDDRDDGGDPTPIRSTNAPPDMWLGRDAVWPIPATR
jgi:hypothetical protein